MVMASSPSCREITLSRTPVSEVSVVIVWLPVLTCSTLKGFPLFRNASPAFLLPPTQVRACSGLWLGLTITVVFELCGQPPFVGICTCVSRTFVPPPRSLCFVQMVASLLPSKKCCSSHVPSAFLMRSCQLPVVPESLMCAVVVGGTSLYPALCVVVILTGCR